jgi:DNA adenine methylase
VALSIDGDKKSGDFICDLPIPPGLFARELSVNIGRSMLKRFQMEGRTLENEVVSDRHGCSRIEPQDGILRMLFAYPC